MIYFNDDMGAPAGGEEMAEGAQDAPAMEGGEESATMPAEGGDTPAEGGEMGGEEAAPAAEGETM